jgi:methyltransferase (TIGR00027 family)
MARADDDSWDITEGVGATALGVAWSRSQESSSAQPLFTDPYAKLFVEAAQQRGWQMPSAVFQERIRRITGYAASRTKFFDEFFIAAGANGVTQAVILAAGLDSRAWRLPWLDDAVVYEIDQPLVLAFKAEVLQSHDVQPAARYVPVPIDLRQDWPKALVEAGFDTREPAAWSVEGLLPYLPADGQDLLFERIHRLSARGSRVAVEAFGAGVFDSDYLAKRTEQLRRLREESGATDDKDAFDVQNLWYVEDRADVADWLRCQCWDVTSIDALDLMARYGREPEDADAIPRTTFVEGHLSS